jgi:hypothetical protein
MQQPFVPNQQPSVWKIGESARSGVPEFELSRHGKVAVARLALVPRTAIRQARQA